jgi:hypothetical protein
MLFPFTPQGELLASQIFVHSNQTFKSIEDSRFVGKLTYLRYYIPIAGSNPIFIFTDGELIVGPRGFYPDEHYLKKYAFCKSKFCELIPHLKNGEITGSFIPCILGNKFSWMLE